MNRTRTRLVVLVVTALAALGVITAAPAGASTGCGITWGSLAKSATQVDDNFVTGVRAGRHACYDRLVVDLGGRDLRFGTYWVRYVDVVRRDGSGSPVPVRGAADLEIVVGAPAHDDHRVTFTGANSPEIVSVAGFDTFRQVAGAGSFEGQTTLALGVRARLPFRVFTLPALPGSEAGPRLVVDVAHRW
jgi:hypothetical protein